jgi:hypothetical protein
MQSSETSRFEPLLSLPRPIHVVTHDAGAAEHIFYWLTHLLGERLLRRDDLTLSACGPSLNILRSEFGALESLMVYGQDAPVPGAASLLAGTGWASDVEWSAINEYQARGAKTAAVIDHWVNFEERMQRNGEQARPDKYLVVDGEAEAIACRTWGGPYVQRLPDLKFEEVKKQLDGTQAKDTVLYAAEPFPEAWSDRVGKELEVLSYALSCLQTSGLEFRDLIVRPHPAESIQKYLKFSQSHENISIKVTREQPLADVLSKSVAVVSADSSVLALAINLGIPAFCSLPPQFGRSRLPHRQIQYFY